MKRNEAEWSFRFLSFLDCEQFSSGVVLFRLIELKSSFILCRENFKCLWRLGLDPRRRLTEVTLVCKAQLCRAYLNSFVFTLRLTSLPIEKKPLALHKLAQVRKMSKYRAQWGSSAGSKFPQPKMLCCTEKSVMSFSPCIQWIQSTYTLTWILYDVRVRTAFVPFLSGNWKFYIIHCIKTKSVHFVWNGEPIGYEKMRFERSKVGMRVFSPGTLLRTEWEYKFVNIKHVVSLLMQK